MPEKSDVTIQDCLAKYLEKETLQEIFNLIAQYVKKEIASYVKQGLTKAPQILRVTINRFTQGVDPERMTTPLLIKEHENWSK